MLYRLRRQPEPLRRVKSVRIACALRRLPEYRKARAILCYADFDGEVQTRAILEKALSEGKKVFVPVVTDRTRRHRVVAQVKDLEKDLAHRGHYGIAHPLRLFSKEIPLAKLGLVILPGVAFDVQGGRLGRGGGYFDRFLPKVPLSVPRVGLAFRFQVVAKLPREAHDQPISRVITE
jgi:5-formyltetrahydrofolate cyclo-ligase